MRSGERKRRGATATAAVAEDGTGAREESSSVQIVRRETNDYVRAQRSIALFTSLRFNSVHFLFSNAAARRRAERRRAER